MKKVSKNVTEFLCKPTFSRENVIFAMFWEDLGKKKSSQVDKNITIVFATLDYIYG